MLVYFTRITLEDPCTDQLIGGYEVQCFLPQASLSKKGRPLDKAVYLNKHTLPPEGNYQELVSIS